MEEIKKTKSSYEKINYSLRPAKSVERKMFCEAMIKLSHFHNIEKYQYVGFGSTYFSDFSLIHKNLGIKKMVSIEKDDDNSDRFEFNRPFSCIGTIFKHSNQALSEINWKIPTVLWLDYDYRIENSMLQDIKTFFSQALPSSMFMVTLDIKPDEPKNKKLDGKKLKEFRINELRDRISRNNLPLDIESRNLGIKGNIDTAYEIIKDHIDEIIRFKNSVIKNSKKKIVYKQLFNFYYNDGTPMLTIGGLIYEQKDEEKYVQAKFKNLRFFKDDKNPFKIEIPSLTFKEIHALDKLLPNNINKNGIIDPIAEKKSNLPKLKKLDVKKYVNIYRYFPTFAEANL